MHALRTISILRLWVLVWLTASVVAAVASPLVRPQAIDWVCTSAGTIKFVVQTSEGTEPIGTMGMDCPLCTHVAAPPVGTTTHQIVPSPLSYALRPVQAAHLAVATAAPLPARGPPLSRV